MQTAVHTDSTTGFGKPESSSGVQPRRDTRYLSVSRDAGGDNSAEMSGNLPTPLSIAEDASVIEA